MVTMNGVIATGTVGFGVGVMRGLSSASHPPADEDERPGEGQDSRSGDREDQVLRQRRVDRRQIDVKLTHNSITPPRRCR